MQLKQFKRPALAVELGIVFVPFIYEPIMPLIQPEGYGPSSNHPSIEELYQYLHTAKFEKSEKHNRWELCTLCNRS